MTGQWNIRLSGTLETLSPFCVVAPGAEEVRRPDGSKYKKIVTRTIYNAGVRESKPVVPGSTLRGRLRRSAVEVVRGLVGEKVTLQEWHQNAVGGIKGSESEAGHDVAMREQLRKANPILGLFGAGSPWMIGRASIGDGVPHEHVTTDIVGGVRADDGRRDNGFFEKLTDDATDTWMAMVDANSARTKLKAEEKTLKADLRAARKDGNSAEAARLEGELKDAAGREDALKLLSTNSVSMPLQHEAMPAGVQMLHRITLKGVTAAEAGLFIAAMNHFLKDKPHVGQHEALGYGLLRGEYDVFISPANSSDPFAVAGADEKSVGTMIAEPTMGLTGVPSQLVEFMQAFQTQFADGAFNFGVASDVVGKGAKA